MLRSMTGFGRGEYTDGKRNVVVEIRTVNHRYLDMTVKMPRRYGFAEDKIKQAIKDEISRGKMDISVMVEDIASDDTNIKLNQPLAKQYFDNLKELKEAFNLEGNVDLRLLASMPDVIKTIPDIESEEEITNSLLIPTKEAVKNLQEMRGIEGEKLAKDMLSKKDSIKENLDEISSRAPLVPKEYMTKLKARIEELLGDSVQIPEDRILTEAAIFADKCAIDEEITRLNSHLVQFENIVKNSKEPEGKKLDFLVQEMNREANTIGSKANDIEITTHMLNIKNEIEKIREQVQNIE